MDAAIRESRLNQPADEPWPRVPAQQRTLVVTAADEAFAPLLRDLVESLHQWSPAPFSGLAVFDLGLAAETRNWISRRASCVAEPGWDLAVDLSVRAQRPHLRALTARPFLPEYFPGYDIYLWIDADAWVQERFALDWLIGAAATRALAAVPEVDPSYRQTSAVANWRLRRARAYFSGQGDIGTIWDPYFNAGVFALHADAPHWAIWKKWFRIGLEATAGKLCCDQTALNQALQAEGLAIHPLPALCNWLCHLSTPDFDPRARQFREPGAAGRALGIVHLADSNNHRGYSSGPPGTRQGLRFPGSPGPSP